MRNVNTGSMLYRSCKTCFSWSLAYINRHTKSNSDTFAVISLILLVFQLIKNAHSYVVDVTDLLRKAGQVGSFM